MGLKKYSCLLFDLDHTLWDFESNSEETLQELFHKHGLQQRGVTSFNYFYETFVRVNTKLWDLHDRNLIGTEEIRTQRFHKVFGEAGLDDHPLSLQFSSDFLRELPNKKNLLPHALETLTYLHERYPMAVVTNGFDELQAAKMISAGIHHYFKKVVTSQRAGNKKPSREIFEFALAELGYIADDAIMIGDNLQTDIAGARRAGIHAIYFNPSGALHEEDVTHEIKSLKELQTLL
jgi:YjjG family noncanonical pyrimidine nucleotidase